MQTTVGRVAERNEGQNMSAQWIAAVLAGERLLRLAVLEQAVQDLRLARRIARGPSTRLRNDALTFLRRTEAWFEDRADAWPYGFESLCTGLDVDADSLRRRLRIGVWALRSTRAPRALARLA